MKVKDSIDDTFDDTEYGYTEVGIPKTIAVLDHFAKTGQVVPFQVGKQVRVSKGHHSVQGLYGIVVESTWRWTELRFRDGSTRKFPNDHLILWS